MNERFKTFTTLIAKISRNIRRIKTVEMSEFNLKSPHVSCLYYLYTQKELTAKELCDFCDEDKAAISRSIEYLENEGYITCDSKLAKRYKSPLTLTQKGSEVASKVAEKIDNILMKASLEIKEEEREIFYKNLTIISDNLQEICDKYGE